jgi:hypothetical protein
MVSCAAGFYLTDFDAIGGVLPLVDRVAWGNEDTQLVATFAKHSIGVRRKCTPELWHLWHAKAAWKESLDGISHGRSGTSSSNSSRSSGEAPADGAVELRRRREHRVGLCHKLFKLYRLPSLD